MAPRLSVIMPTYNKASFVRESVESILEQDYQDLELIVMNDGSTDETAEVLGSFKDPRLTVISRANRGIMPCMNEGLSLAKGELISRMDHDDLSVPGRFSKQITYLDQNPTLDALGTWVRTFGAYETEYHFPIKHENIKAALMFETAMNMSAVIVRRTAFEKAGYYYDDAYRYAEDCDLWHRLLISGARVENLPECLFLNRLHQGQASKIFEEAQTRAADEISRKWLSLIDLQPNAAQFAFHKAVAKGHWKPEKSFYQGLQCWLLQVLEANQRKNYFDQVALQNFVEDRWQRACRSGTALGPWIFCEYLRAPLRSTQSLRRNDWIKFLIHSSIFHQG
jgi:glycosyltransferase involved in cell wall biosynthesis